MDLRSLKVFLDAVEHGSLSKAAARNFITPSAVSQQLKALEEELGTSLLIRERSGVSQTEAGRVVAEHARALLGRVERIISDVKALEGKVAGNLRIGSIYSVGLYFLPPYISEFIRTYPDAHIHMTYLRSDDIASRVASGALDLGAVAYPRASEGLTVVSVGEDPIVLVVPAGHRLAGRPDVAPSEIADEPFIAFHHETPTGAAIQRFLSSAGVRVRITHEFDNIDTIKRAVEVGAGISLVPSETILACEQDGLITVPFARGGLVRPLGLLRRRTLGAAAEAFVGLLTWRGPGVRRAPRTRRRPS